MSDPIRERDFTLAQVLYRDPRPVSDRHPAGWEHRCERFVVLSPFKRTARPIAERYARERWGDFHELHLYPRTYVDDARALIAAGRWVDV